MSQNLLRPSGDFRTTYKEDQTLFPTKWIFIWTVIGFIFVCFVPYLFSAYITSLLLLIGIYGIAAIGLNVLTGMSGQISLGHSAFFGFGAFASAYINAMTGIPVLIAIPLAGLMTTAVGLIFGIPAARIKGLYLAIATLASQFILEDFFARAEWFTGGSSGTVAETPTLFGLTFDTDTSYFYLVLFWVVVSAILVANLKRSRDGRALIAVRDHYLSAEIMGINLTKYRILAFGISSFFAGVAGALYGHYLGYVSAEGFTIILSVQFIGMIIIGGLGSVPGALMGAAFIILLPEVMEALVSLLVTSVPFMAGLETGKAYIKEMSIGAAIIIFLIFEPEGLAHRCGQIRKAFKLYPFSY